MCNKACEVMGRALLETKATWSSLQPDGGHTGAGQGAKGRSQQVPFGFNPSFLVDLNFLFQ